MVTVPSNLVPTRITDLPLLSPVPEAASFVAVYEGVSYQVTLAGTLGNYALQSTTLTAGTGLTGGGDLSTDRTFALADTAVTAASYGSATQASTFTVDAQGRLTAAASVTVTPAWGSVTSIPAIISALENLSGTGLVTKTATGVLAARTVTGTSAEITATNGDGVSGNPTLSLPTAMTLTGKTLTGGSYAAVAAFGLRSSGAAFDLQLASTEVFTASRALTVTLNDAARAIDLGGDLTLAGALTTSGAHALTCTLTGATNVTFPTSGTLSTTTGTVTSVDVSGGTTGLSFADGPITSSGTITMSGTLIVGNGGTGRATQTAYAVLCGGTTSTAAQQSIASVGTAGQVLISAGAGALPAFGDPPDVAWTLITADPSPAVSDHGYLCDTSGGAFTLTLPLTPTVGDTVYFADAAGTFDTASLTVGRNGENIMGTAADMTVSTEYASGGLVYSDATNGWRLI